ncbi:hypothetical protein [Stieleria maiorica]|nr:hypothetical protein [Stieleria maiorica]
MKGCQQTIHRTNSVTGIGSRRYTLISGNRFMDYTSYEGDNYDFQWQ